MNNGDLYMVGVIMQVESCNVMEIGSNEISYRYGRDPLSMTNGAIISLLHTQKHGSCSKIYD